MQVYLVGGAVRDKLLGYPYHERDWVVVGATPEALLAKGFTPVGKDFPVFLHPTTKEEYALARTERKTAPGYTGFAFHASPDVSLEEDLIRRDLTINAIAEDEQGQLFDPFNGAQDIRDKKLRHVSDAFSEDPVRILRIARFAARYHHLGFTVAKTTTDLMRSMVEAGEADHLVAERAWKEMSRALGERNPEVFFQVLRACGALAKILPELDQLFGIPQPPQHHPEIDTGVHSLMVLQQACLLSDDTCVRFAALVHDLGKGKTPADNWPRHINHEQLGLPVIKALCKRLAVPNECRDLGLLAAQFHTHVHRAFELRPDTLLKLIKQTDALRRPERFAQLLLACEADSRGRTGFEQCDYSQPQYLLRALELCQQVDVKTLVASGLQGLELGAAIDAERLQRLKELQQQQRKDQTQ
ncbi:multifunctional CCA addition/repair protein [Gilvimarinus polysaccharolyticus]|uniref:multifunctional CCA addition/repair protein n=1 Tax=Gilvimarinus polysaccharolyticus TaxID=863921 RepID=UPI0006730D17|nr:multifunctional CCA addition/repair protein [Gilvimarinus polysaccharolyticus]